MGKRILRAIGLWMGLSAALCGLVFMLSGMMGVAGFLVLGELAPPFPWFIPAMFSAVLVQIAALVAIASLFVKDRP